VLKNQTVAYRIICGLIIISVIADGGMEGVVGLWQPR